MCGIAGILSSEKQLVSTQRLKMMSDSLSHRGPDGEASWANSSGNAGFSHRRLSIIDIGPSGAQPMHYGNRFTIVYNGEIYNYIEVRDILLGKGFRFNTNSDTEVILAAYSCWKENCVSYFDGMFAFAIWDEKEKMLFAARDRFGEKPFFYFNNGREFSFASEMKALWAAGVSKGIDEQMLYNYITLGYTQNPADNTQTFYKAIHQLAPASWLTYHLPTGKLTRKQYWNISLQAELFEGTDVAATEKFRELFDTSVKRRLRSDVPLGTSLSGGLDSSSIVAAIAASGADKIQSFSAVFPGFEKDESGYIDIMTSAFELESHKIEPDISGFISDFDKLCYYQEEPFSSSSVYSQYKVFELAKERGVKVLLDGQGADETIAGYRKYFPRYWQQLFNSNRTLLRTEMAAAASNGIKAKWGWKNILATQFPSTAKKRWTKTTQNRQTHAGSLTKEFVSSFGISNYAMPAINDLNAGLYYDTFSNGLGELLRYADRNSMAHGREVRLPFLYHELVSFVFTLPAHHKIRNGFTKWILRKAMHSQLPEEITWRKDKTGFEPPQQSWMNEPRLQDYLADSKLKLVQMGILEASVIDKKNQPLSAFAADNFDWRYLVTAKMI